MACERGEARAVVQGQRRGAGAAPPCLKARAAASGWGRLFIALCPLEAGGAQTRASSGRRAGSISGARGAVLAEYFLTLGL